MQKRTNPLDLVKEEHKITKRTNPLELGEKVEEKKDFIKIESMPDFKKRMVFTRISKELVSLLKETYKDEKLGRIIEYTMLTHLNSINKSSLEHVLKEKDGDKE